MINKLIFKVSFGKIERTNNQNQTYPKIKDMPFDVVELSTKKSNYYNLLIDNFVSEDDAKKIINDEKRLKKFLQITSQDKNGNSPFGLTEPISYYEASLIISEHPQTDIQKYINYTRYDKKGKPISGLKRVLSFDEAVTLSTKNLSQNQLEYYINLTGNKIHPDFALKIIEDEQKLQRYNDLTVSAENLQRKLTGQEAVNVIMNNFSDEQSQHYINLLDENIFQANEIINDSDKLRQIINLVSSDKDNKPLSGLSRVLTYKEAIDVCENAFTFEQQQHYINLIDDKVNKHHARDIVQDKNKLEQLIRITSDKPTIKINRKMLPFEAVENIRRNFSDIQIETYTNLVDNVVYGGDAEIFVRDENKLNRYLELTSKTSTIELSRTLQPDEAYSVITENLTNEQIQEFINLKTDFSSSDFALCYAKDFLEYKNIKSLDELPIKDRKKLLKLIIKHNIRLFTDKEIKEYKLIPKNSKEYCAILPQIVASVGINIQPLTQSQLDLFNDAINEIPEHISKDCEITFDFSVDEFIKQISQIINKLDKKEQRKVLNYFSFEIENGKLKGHPSNYKKQNKERNITIEELRPIVQFFLQNNNIKINGNKKLENCLNKIIKTLPEIRTTLNKDILNTLYKTVNHPKFETLSDNDKKVLIISSLLLSEEPNEASFDASYIIQKLDLNEDEKRKIYSLIKTYNYTDKSAQNIAFDLRYSNTFKLSEIFNNRKSPEIKNLISELTKNEIFLPQTQIPKASNLKNAQTISADGITNKILYINKLDNDLSKYGFKTRTTKSNWQSLVHGFSNENQLEIFKTFSMSNSEALLSTSYMTPKEYRVFRKQGFILDVHPSDIHVGYFRDFGSGYKKEIEELTRNYLFKGGQMYKYRKYIPDLIKEKLNIDDNKYVEYISQLQGCKSLEDIFSINPKFANALKSTFEEMDLGRRNDGREYNEILVSHPKIQGVFSYEQKYEDIPIFLRKFAQDNDMPIIMFGDYK